MKRIVSIVLLQICLCTMQPHSVWADSETKTFEQQLETFREKYHLPALAAAVVKGDQIIAIGAVGVRKAGTAIPVTVDDKWFIGSCGKSMTATLAARIVEQGKITWDTTLEQVFPHPEKLHPRYRKVTLAQLLSHTGGAPQDEQFSAQMVHRLITDIPKDPMRPLPEQRLAAAEAVLAQPPMNKPGQLVYSNAGYVFAGMMLELVMGEPYETLIQRMLFAPLGFTSAGFGPPATPNTVDQPWGHMNGKPIAPEVEEAENPLYIAPCGLTHLSIRDFATYAALHLQGARGIGGLLAPATFNTLHTPPKMFRFINDGYAFGWMVSARGGQRYLWHNGCDGMFYALMLLAPEEDFAIVVTTMADETDGAQGTTPVAQALAQAYFHTKITCLPTYKNWQVMLGGVAAMSPVYPGSDQFDIFPFPLFQVEYTTQYVDFFAGTLQGVGLRMKAPESIGLSLTTAASLGAERNPDDKKVKDVLTGTPKLEGKVSVLTTLAAELPFGSLSSTLTWLPLTAKYDEAEHPDQVYQCLSVGLDAGTSFPLTERLFLEAGLGASWMNRDYAEAYYGIRYPTSKFQPFRTESSLQNVHASLSLLYILTQRIHLIVQSEGTQLLGNAADSPLTKHDFQPEVVLGASYSF